MSVVVPVTVAQAERLRQQLERDLTKLIDEFEAQTGLHVVEIDGGIFVQVPGARVRSKPVTVEVRL